MNNKERVGYLYIPTIILIKIYYSASKVCYNICILNNFNYPRP